MQIITDSKEYWDECGNAITGKFKLINSKIIFSGKNSIVFFDDVTVNNCTIFVRNSNSLLFVEKNKLSNIYQFVISENCNCIIRQGLTNGRMSIRVGEGNIIIGKDCMFSQDIYIQNHDGHPIYDIQTGNLLNPGKSIIIGDHVWLGESVSVMKGAQLGSGLVVGSKSFLSNKTYAHNTIYAGIPARPLKSNVFWKRLGLHVAPMNKRQEMLTDNSRDFIFNEQSLTYYRELDKLITNIATPADRLKFIKEYLKSNSQ